MQIIKAIKALFSMFTIIPIKITDDDILSLSKNFWVLPLIGIIFGILASVSLFILNIFFMPHISATITLMLIHFLNRFMHVEGLVDFGDGLIKVGDKKEKFEAMRDARVGAGGVTLLILITILTVAAYSSIPIKLIFIPFMAEILSRGAIVICAGFGKPYRDGLGSSFTKFTSQKDCVKVVILLTMIMLVAYPIQPTGLNFVEFVPIIFALIILSCISGMIISYIALKSIGYVTGDVLGAANEISRVFILLISLKVFTL